MKILMVCLGNFCRSPLAEGILKEKVKKAELDWKVDSAGTRAYLPGCPPHDLAQKVARLNRLSINEQACRNFIETDIEIFDKIYVMDKDNYYDVKRICGNKWNKNKVDYILNELYPGQDMNVPDPWYGGEDGFHKVYKMLDMACEQIIKPYITRAAKQVTDLQDIILQ
jgi:protein-tyrosine phosphatase